MAMIDYGALLRVNKKFINKNKNLFMDSSNTGYILDKAKYVNTCKDVDINGNFYVYAGDKDLLLTFYKGIFYVISNGLILKTESNVPFISETFYIGNAKIKVSYLEPEIQIELDDVVTWREYVRENWRGATGNEKLCELENGLQQYKIFLRQIKRKALKRDVYKYRTNRWIAEWEHNGDNYEVIFG